MFAETVDAKGLEQRSRELIIVPALRVGTIPDAPASTSQQTAGAVKKAPTQSVGAIIRNMIVKQYHFNASQPVSGTAG
jgi:hypothetical protein